MAAESTVSELPTYFQFSLDVRLDWARDIASWNPERLLAELSQRIERSWTSARVSMHETWSKGDVPVGLPAAFVQKLQEEETLPDSLYAAKLQERFKTCVRVTALSIGPHLATREGVNWVPNESEFGTYWGSLATDVAELWNALEVQAQLEITNDPMVRTMQDMAASGSKKEKTSAEGIFPLAGVPVTVTESFFLYPLMVTPAEDEAPGTRANRSLLRLARLNAYSLGLTMRLHPLGAKDMRLPLETSPISVCNALDCHPDPLVQQVITAMSWAAPHSAKCLSSKAQRQTEEHLAAVVTVLFWQLYYRFSESKQTPTPTPKEGSASGPTTASPETDEEHLLPSARALDPQFASFQWPRVKAHHLGVSDRVGASVKGLLAATRHIMKRINPQKLVRYDAKTDKIIETTWGPLLKHQPPVGVSFPLCRVLEIDSEDRQTLEAFFYPQATGQPERPSEMHGRDIRTILKEADERSVPYKSLWDSVKAQVRQAARIIPEELQPKLWTAQENDINMLQPQSLMQMGKLNLRVFPTYTPLSHVSPGIVTFPMLLSAGSGYTSRKAAQDITTALHMAADRTAIRVMHLKLESEHDVQSALNLVQDMLKQLQFPADIQHCDWLSHMVLAHGLQCLQRLRLISRLRIAGLAVKLDYAGERPTLWNRTIPSWLCEQVVLVGLPNRITEIVAEKTGLHKVVNLPRQLPAFTSAQFLRGGPLQRYKMISSSHPLRPYEPFYQNPGKSCDPCCCFSLADKHSILDVLFLNECRDLHGPLAEKPSAIPGAQMDLNELVKEGIISSFVTLRDPATHAKLTTQWVKPWKGFGILKYLTTHLVFQDINFVQRHYGSKTSMHFAFLRLYTLWLVVPAIAGLAVFAGHVHWAVTHGYDILLDEYSVFYTNGALPGFVALVLVWMGMFVSSWTSKRAELSYMWNHGMQGQESGPGSLTAEQASTEFIFAMEGEMSRSLAGRKRILRYVCSSLGLDLAKVTDKQRQQILQEIENDVKTVPQLHSIPSWNTAARVGVTSILTGACILLSMCVVSSVLFARDETLMNIWGGMEDDSPLMAFSAAGLTDWLKSTGLSTEAAIILGYVINGTINGLVIIPMASLFKALATWLTAWERHRHTSSYDFSLAAKLFSFNFVTGYFSLFYIGLYTRQTEQLRYQLLSLLLVRGVYRNFTEVFHDWALLRMVWRLLRGLFWILETPFRLRRKIVPEVTEGDARAWVNRRRRGEPMGPVLGQSATAVRCLNSLNHEKTLRPPMNTVDEDLEVAMQYGYMVLFATPLPLAALLVLVNNLFEIRIDAFLAHLATRMDRPVREVSRHYVSGFMMIITFVSIFTNGFFIAYGDIESPSIVADVAEEHPSQSPLDYISTLEIATYYLFIIVAAICTFLCVLITFPSFQPASVTVDLHRQSYFDFKLSEFSRQGKVIWGRVAMGMQAARYTKLLTEGNMLRSRKTHVQPNLAKTDDKGQAPDDESDSPMSTPPASPGPSSPLPRRTVLSPIQSRQPLAGG